MFRQIKNVALVAVGTICIIVGVIGLIIPFFPGTPFLLIGAACFSAIEV